MKETALINHVDKQIQKVNRRHAKKFSSAIDGPDELEDKDERGYESFKEVVKDVEAIIDVIWVSGTRMGPPHLCISGPRSNIYLTNCSYF
jgi:hypothetical protein